MNAAADTIAAIATAAGHAGIGVVRISGPLAPKIGAQLLGRMPRERHAHWASFRDRDGAIIDRGLLLYFAAPRSYTGEHVVELQAHGNPLLLHALLARSFELGARPARAGEFTERAFLNGKLDLAQAEAVADLIASTSQTAARAAQRSLDGEFSRRADALSAQLVRVRTWIEAAIDFPEEEIDFLAAPALLAEMDALRLALDDLLAAAQRGVRLTDGLHVVIVGRPNVGKSSLLNALAAGERAIVTEIAGTTRDVLRESVMVNGIALTLADTAGLRETDDVVEREGVRRAHAELARADLALLVCAPPDETIDADLLGTLPTDATRLIVHNKIDLGAEPPRIEQREGNSHVWLSARSGIGIDLLAAELQRHAHAGEGSDGVFSARARHVVALQRAQLACSQAASALAVQQGELAAEELRQAQHAIGELTGSFTSDDLLGEIFASFCIGK
ncbi:MAG: tRNA uridine-5-carboxymethylaminomethyl(34) synthesis GTPase MnmE [Dokdonella sp.]|uniref:tRNA uridine-5-carboxymethylaminomethyl(34) synthesis GTPase MnmE n=1 Tax=Dokdonella sp. TaxID=2291710 RepID=UPI0025C48141|nr:tRNA uridine-5-carboxymethylaminomethyl(34) synthesis GTPase MnmE [Dokdonella sp.]MBZ0223614.1 tRNA uridine-5-carboxymethylaminomethyl(34) synthesis GTPase MnmE [Dokdonella sp.]